MDTAADGGQRSAGYAVLSPWAEVDPVPLRGIAPRLDALEHKTIGLFSNGKRAAALTLGAVEARLRAQAPSLKTSWYTSSKVNTPETLSDGKARFEAWVAGVDAVVLSVAD